VLGGLHMSITGTLLRPQPARSAKEAKEAELRSQEQLKSIKAHRQLLVEVARQLQKFETKSPPQLDIEVSGDLGKPEDLNATVHLTATGLKHSDRNRSDYVCQELEAKITCAGRLVDLTSLETEYRFEGYLKRQEESVARLKRQEDRVIPADFCFEGIPGLSRESVERLSSVRPETIGQALRIPGLTAAAVALIAAHVSGGIRATA